MTFYHCPFWRCSGLRHGTVLKHCWWSLHPSFPKVTWYKWWRLWTERRAPGKEARTSWIFFKNPRKINYWSILSLSWNCLSPGHRCQIITFGHTQVDPESLCMPIIIYYLLPIAIGFSFPLCSHYKHFSPKAHPNFQPLLVLHITQSPGRITCLDLMS